MENKEQPITITDVVGNDKLGGSLYSTFKCSVCGKKLVVKVIGNKLQFVCKEYRYGCGDPSRKEHDSIELNLCEIAAILNFNPLL